MTSHTLTWIVAPLEAPTDQPLSELLARLGATRRQMPASVARGLVLQVLRALQDLYAWGGEGSASGLSRTINAAGICPPHDAISVSPTGRLSLDRTRWVTGGVAVDVRSVGLLLRDLLAVGLDPVALAMGAPLGALRVDVDRVLEETIRRACHPIPSERFGSFGRFVSVIERGGPCASELQIAAWVRASGTGDAEDPRTSVLRPPPSRSLSAEVAPGRLGTLILPRIEMPPRILQLAPSPTPPRAAEGRPSSRVAPAPAPASKRPRIAPLLLSAFALCAAALAVAGVYASAL